MSRKSRILPSQAQIQTRTHAFVFRPIGEPGPRAENAPLTRDHPLPSSMSQEALQALEKSAWERGFHDGEVLVRSECDNILADSRNTLAAAVKEFEDERALYFRQAEVEIVRLVLAIAREILHREAQINPLVLTGVVRVAVEKIATSGTVKLRVPAAEVPTWTDFLATHPDLQLRIQIVEDPSFHRLQCVLETEVGTADLSLEAQLGEIEKGFLDLLALRPARE